MRIASIDPGGTSGLVLVWGEDFTVAMPAHIRVHTAIAQNRLEVRKITGTPYEQVWSIYHAVKNQDVVICEDYIPRAPLKSTARESLDPVRIGFGIELLLKASPHWNGKFVWQQSTQMGVVTNQRLQQWGLWTTGSKDIRSAMKHLVIYLRGHPTG